MPASFPGGWNFVNSYYVKISKAAFGASSFGSVQMGVIHDSPPKVGSNAVTVAPCSGWPAASTTRPCSDTLFTGDFSLSTTMVSGGLSAESSTFSCRAKCP